MPAESMINEIVETKNRGNIFEIKLHSFSEEQIALYEDGMRKALKEKEDYPDKPLYFDFSECVNIPQMDEKAVFDILQFMSFYCMRQQGVQVHWGECMRGFLKSYGSLKRARWKLSGATVRKLLEANCGCF